MLVAAVSVPEIAALAAPRLFLLAVLLAADTVSSRFYRVRPDRDVLAFLHDRTQPGDGVLILSCWLHRSFPLVNETGASWGMRYPMIMHIPAFYADGSWAGGRYHTLASDGRV